MSNETPTAPLPADMPAKFRVKFHDGPAGGIEKEYLGERERVKYFGWTYENAHKRDGDFWLFVARPRVRVRRQLLAALTAHTGQDPRLQPKAVPTKVIPRGRNAVCWCGSGKKYKKCHGGAQ
jgi:SEC-C motif-containing protein